MFSLRKKEPVTLRRTLILTLLPILFKLTVWALIRKAIRNSNTSSSVGSQKKHVI